MAKESSATNGSATEKSRQALRRLDRASKFARESVRMARAAASSAMGRGYGLAIPAPFAVLEGQHPFKAGLVPGKGGDRGGSGSGYDGELDLNKTEARNRIASGADGRHGAETMVKAGARVSRVPELSRAMDALSRVERSFDLGSAGRAISYSSKYATPIAAFNNDSWDRQRAGQETRRPTFAAAEVATKVRVAPSIRGVMPPAGVSQREFARPLSDVRASNEGGGGSTITINSSPTVVINAPAGGAVHDDVIGALRAYREELFDELKRESARRERAQF